MPGVQRSTGSIGPVRVPRMLAFHRDTSMDISTTNNARYVCGVCGVCGVCVVCVAYQEEQFVPFFILAYLTLLRPLPLSFVQTPHRRRTRVRGVKFKIPTIVAVEKERRRKNHKRQKFQARIALRQWQFNEWGRH